MDNLTPGDPMQAPGIAPADATKKSFLGTTSGKLIVGAVAVVLVAAAAAAAFFLFFSSSGEVIAPVTKTGSSNVATGAPEVVVTPVEPPRKSLDAIFTFRNIFKPSAMPVSGIEPVSGGTAGSGGTGGTGTGAGDSGDLSGIPSNTLFFASVAQTNGRAVGSFYWNGTVYSGGAGDRLGQTPWRVVSISGTTATMLFGDTQVSLSVGQGLTK